MILEIPFSWRKTRETYWQKVRSASNYKTFWQKYNVIVIFCYGQKHKNIKQRTSHLTL